MAMEEKILSLLILGFLTISPIDATAANLKLTGGHTTSSSSYGILQVYHEDKWGTVCDDKWGVKNTKVACRQLNFTEGTAIKLTSKETGQIWLEDVVCTGSESSLDECSHPGWGSTKCFHMEDVGLVCSGAWTTSVRLAGGSTPNEGRVEIQMYGLWGTICNTGWDIFDANVVCRMMNYSGAITASQRFGNGTGPIWLTELGCKGDEKNILNCSHGGLKKASLCSHGNDVGVICFGYEDPNIAVRLVDGNSPNQGRVEVQYYGVWGTVCDDNWGLADAYVVCRMLDYNKASWAGTARVKGRGPILLDEVGCRGTEVSLEFCRYPGLSREDCTHVEDAGVTCDNSTREESSVRLVGGLNHFGRVEIEYKETWLPICGDTWDIHNAHVICRMLGYQGALTGIKNFGVGTPGLWMGGVKCSGEEVSISECYHRGWSNTRCPGYYYAGVMCKTSKELPPVTVRLEDGSVPTSGRIAVHYGNVWGTICNDGLDIRDAKVICRMLGYVEALKVHRKNTFKPKNGTMWLSDLGCIGTESSIVDCRHPGWGETTCNHDNEGAVMCKTADPPQFYINGSNAITGTTAVVLFEDSGPVDARLKRAYQVAVEKRETSEHHFKSYKQTKPFAIHEINATMAIAMGENVYITAEIIGHRIVPRLSIGDGLYYNGYLNAPLHPGSTYRVYVRVVTMTMDKKKVYGNLFLVAFTTKPVVAKTVKQISEKNSSGQVFKTMVIVLSVIIALGIVVAMAIGRFVWKKKSEKTMKIEMTEMSTATSRRTGDMTSGHYEDLNPATQTSTQQGMSEDESKRTGVAGDPRYESLNSSTKKKQTEEMSTTPASGPISYQSHHYDVLETFESPGQKMSQDNPLYQDV